MQIKKQFININGKLEHLGRDGKGNYLLMILGEDTFFHIYSGLVTINLQSSYVKGDYIGTSENIHYEKLKKK